MGIPPTRKRRHGPLGPGGSWKSGQRVPQTGRWIDQHGDITFHEAGCTFPPLYDAVTGTGECAFRRLLTVVTPAATLY